MITTANCVDGSGNGSKSTMPVHIWIHSVELTAIRHGASLTGIEAARAVLSTWFNAGEPVWMAADGLLNLARGYDRRQLENADGFSAFRKACRDETRASVVSRRSLSALSVLPRASAEQG